MTITVSTAASTIGLSCHYAVIMISTTRIKKMLN